MEERKKRAKRVWKVFLFITFLAGGIIFVSLWSGRLIPLNPLEGAEVENNSQKEVNLDLLTIDNFRTIPGVTQEFVEASKMFLKTQGGDNASPTYEDVVSAFQKISNTTKNQELKLHCLYFITLSNFLQNKIDEAYQSAMELFALTRRLHPDDLRVQKLDKIISAIKEGEIKDVEGLKEVIFEEEIGAFIEELSLVSKSFNDYGKLKEKVKTKK